MPKILVVGDADVYRDLERILGKRDVEFADTYIWALKIATRSYDNFILAGWLPMFEHQNPQSIGVQLAKEISRKLGIDYEKFKMVSEDYDVLAEAKKLGIKELYSKLMADEEQGFKSIYQLLDDLKKDFGL